MIETKRLLLKLISEDDIDALLRIYTDPKVLKNFDMKPFSREQMEVWVKKDLEHQAKYGYGLFSVLLKSNHELIGECGLVNTDFEGGNCVELRYNFISEYWHQGYATEAAKALITYAITKLNIEKPRICSFIRTHNKASQRVVEKIGMKRVKSYQKDKIDFYLYRL